MTPIHKELLWELIISIIDVLRLLQYNDTYSLTCGKVSLTKMAPKCKKKNLTNAKLTVWGFQPHCHHYDTFLSVLKQLKKYLRTTVMHWPVSPLLRQAQTFVTVLVLTVLLAWGGCRFCLPYTWHHQLLPFICQRGV